MISQSMVVSFKEALTWNPESEDPDPKKKQKPDWYYKPPEVWPSLDIHRPTSSSGMNILFLCLYLLHNAMTKQLALLKTLGIVRASFNEVLKEKVCYTTYTESEDTDSDTRPWFYHPEVWPESEESQPPRQGCSHLPLVYDFRKQPGGRTSWMKECC